MIDLREDRVSFKRETNWGQQNKTNKEQQQQWTKKLMTQKSGNETKNKFKE